MRVKFWGVRGSTPTPQRENMGFGGNTSCTEVRTDDNAIFIFDGGTGIRLLGQELEEEFRGRPLEAHIFLSHFHLDHIQGIPFFRPLYNADNRFTFYFAGGPEANTIVDALAGLMANPYFPVDISKLPSSRRYVDLTEGAFNVGAASMMVLPLEHPQGCVGYRLTHNGKAVAYCTDVEHGTDWSDTNVRRLAENADLFIVDSQYTPEELPQRAGWGHSSWKQAIDAGIAASARRIVLYHHDPGHEDARLESILEDARRYYPNVIAAREGLEVAI